MYPSPLMHSLHVARPRSTSQVPLYAVVGEKEIAAQSLSLMYRKDGGLLDLGSIAYKQAIERMARFVRRYAPEATGIARR